MMMMMMIRQLLLSFFTHLLCLNTQSGVVYGKRLPMKYAESLENSVWPYAYGLDSNAIAICRNIHGLNKVQVELCQRYTDVTLAALDGLRIAVQECQHQFRSNRWNCSSLVTKHNNPYSSVFFQRGYRESAFASAILSAGVAHNVARACSQGRLISCGCESNSYRYKRPFTKTSIISSTSGININNGNRWKWGGCSHNVHYGIEFAKLFLDTREQATDFHSRISLHNNQAGRLAIANNMQIRCKCHGMSGSCELKTCWKFAPDFRQVGKIIRNRFRNAIPVDQSNMGNGSPLLLNRISSKIDKKTKKNRKRVKTTLLPPSPSPLSPPPSSLSTTRRKKRNAFETQLLYYQRSPNFCDRNTFEDITGTVDRICNRTSGGSDDCGSLCCGRGYNMLRRRRIERCNCTFQWCCEVQCQSCTIDEWISVCK